MKNWYTIRARGRGADGSRAEVLIYDEIGAYGISARGFLAELGALPDGVPIDLRKIKTPAYWISTREDHIAPWRTTYLGTRLLNGPKRFVLGGSGHIAGIVNPPSANKYGYCANEALPESADDWLQGSTAHEGSWWTDWAAWVAGYNGKQVDARQPGEGKLAPIEDAPGRYVKARLV